MAENITALTNYAGGQGPADLVYIAMSPFGPTDDRKSTLADLFDYYNKNTTDGSFQMQGIAAPSVSAAGVGKFYFDSTSNTFKVSQNGGAFFDIGSGNLSGSLTSGRVPYASGATALTDNAGLTFTPNALTIGTAASPGGLRLVGLTGNYWNLASQSPASSSRTFYFPDNTSPTTGNFLFVGTFGSTVQTDWSTGLTWSNSTKQITVTASTNAQIGLGVQNTNAGTAAECVVGFTANGGAISLISLTSTAFTTSGLYKANQLYWRGTTGITEMLFALDDASTAFKFGVNNAVAASINATSTEGLVLGIASTLTGRIKLYNSAGATYTQISAGNAASSLNYILPATAPTAGQVLTAAAPSGSNVTLSWGAGGGGALAVNNVSGSPTFAGVTTLLVDDVNGGISAVNSGGNPSLGVVAGTGISVTSSVAVDQATAFAWTAAHTLSVNSTQSATTAGTTYQPSTTPSSGQYRWSPAVVLNGAANSGSGAAATGFRLYSKGSDANGTTALTVEQRNLQISATWFQVASISQTGGLSLGVASQSTGGLTLFNSAGATSTTLQAGNAASSLTFVWPAADPTAGQVLSASAPSGGVVTLSWASGGSGSPGGSNKQLQFNNSSAFGGAAGFEYQSGANPNVLIQAQNAAYTPLNLRGASSQSAPLLRFSDSTAQVNAEIRVYDQASLYFGYLAGNGASGAGNTVFGSGAGQSLSTAINNTFVGYNAGLLTTGGANTFVGMQAGIFNTSGARNVFIGQNAGLANTTGSDNAFLGQGTGAANTTGGNLVFIGSGAGVANTSGTRNVFVGYYAGNLTNTGYDSTFVGSNAGQKQTSGNSNTYIGANAGVETTTAYGNTFVGNIAGYLTTTGYENTHVGVSAGYTNTTGYRNSFFGHYAGHSNDTGYQNTFIGQGAGYHSLNGTSNASVGYQALYNGRAGSDSVGLGANADRYAPPVGMTATAVAGAGLAVGRFRYAVSYVLNGVESALSNYVQQSTTLGNQQMNLAAIPTYSGPLTCSARKIYRTLVDGLSTFYLLTTISDNTTTTYSDTTPDGSLGAQATDYGPIAAIGSGAKTFKAAQFILGSDTAPISELWLGRGYYSASAPGASVAVRATSASGPDAAGMDLILGSGLSTGNASGGAILFATSTVGTSGSTLNTSSTKLSLTADGRLYGSALHNNTGAITGTVNQYIASGTYTPTITAVANCDAVGAAGLCQWIRVGNVVTVSGELTVDPTAATTLTQVGISLPIASNLAGQNECCGTAATGAVSGYSGAIIGDVTNDRAELDFTTLTDVADRTWSFTFTYLIS